jgi:hypothetical protein
MHEALCRPSSTTLDMVHAEDGPPITQRTSGLEDATSAALKACAAYGKTAHLRKIDQATGLERFAHFTCESN